MKTLILLTTLLLISNCFAFVGDGGSVIGGGGGASRTRENSFDSIGRNLRPKPRIVDLDSIFMAPNINMALENLDNGERIRLSNFREYLNENSGWSE